MITSTKLSALILAILPDSFLGNLSFIAFFTSSSPVEPLLEKLCDHLPDRTGINTHQRHDEHENGSCFGRGEPQNAIHEPDPDSRHEQATNYDPE